MRTFGWRVWNGTVSFATKAIDDGMAASRRFASTPVLKPRMSWRIARASPTSRRAHTSTRSPSGVKP